MPKRLLKPAVMFATSVLASFPVGAADSLIGGEPDLELGAEINELCAGCHGEFAQGTKDSEYPRLAGQPAAYIERQLLLFRERKRPNMPMLEYVDERQMPDSDIRDVSAFIASIDLPTTLPPIDKATYDPLKRLLLAKRTINIPRADGDIEAGRELYKRECRSCHGSEGEGDRGNAVPMLAGQYTDYLWRQVKKYREGIRIHDPEDPEDRLLTLFNDRELQDIFAYMSVVDD